jgi:hypothetical protein
MKVLRKGTVRRTSMRRKVRSGGVIEVDGEGENEGD